MDIPKIFWAYYDHFRRKQITLTQFSEKTGITKENILCILKEKNPNILVGFTPENEKEYKNICKEM